MSTARRKAFENLYTVLEAYERLYQFRDPNNACLFDLRVNECYALELIVERQPMSVMDIANGLGVHKSNASRIARSLQENGYLAASPDADDGRSVRFRATGKGVKKYESVKSYLIARFERTLRGLDPGQIVLVADAMKLLTADAEARMADQCAR